MSVRAHHHYVPVLRWKKGEQEALLHLFTFGGAKSLDYLTPLIEIPPDDFLKMKPPSKQEVMTEMAAAAEAILQNWGSGLIFVDLLLLPSNIYNKRFNGLELLWNEMRLRELSLIPVTGLNRPTLYQRTVKLISQKSPQGICLRINIEELNKKSITDDITTLLKALDVPIAKVDLVIDCLYIENFNLSIEDITRRVPFLNDWRSFILISGGFPKDLSLYQVGTKNLLPRFEWIHWRDHVTKNTSKLRLPAFGDYTVRHPIYKVMKGAHVSASIRYTCDENWVVLRGEWVRKPGSGGYKQYPAQAALLVEEEEFYGASFSYGDERIAFYSGELLKPEIEYTGNPTTWVMIGINHHLSVTLKQVSDLADS